MQAQLAAAAVNHLLEQQAHEKLRLRAHAGKTARILAGGVELGLLIRPDGSFAESKDLSAPAVTLSIAAADLPRLINERERAASFVKVEGDAELAQVLSQLAQGLRWDAEADFARVFGDLLGVRLAATAREGLQAARKLHESVAGNVTEYLLEENPMLVRQQTQADFAAEVSRLRDDVERLGKRIDKLMGRA